MKYIVLHWRTDGFGYNYIVTAESKEAADAIVRKHAKSKNITVESIIIEVYSEYNDGAVEDYEQLS